MKNPLLRLVICTAFVLAWLTACEKQIPTASPSSTLLPGTTWRLPTASATPAPSATSTSVPPATPSPAPTPATPSASALCAAETCVLPWDFPLQRPIAPPGNSTVAPTYRFGSNYHSLRDPHHGVDMGNPQGTPVQAAAAGTVVFAGSDAQTAVGPYTNFYGKVVIIQHANPMLPEPLFTLYGHLETVTVETGQIVQTGEIIGTVGSRGVATGPHLHFEVRLGENTYDVVQNPELWLAPPSPENGALAMRLTTPDGTPLHLEAITVRGIDAELPTRYLETYTAPFPGDPRLHENLAIGALPAGHYQVEITCCGHLDDLIITIQPQHLTMINLTLQKP